MATSVLSKEAGLKGKLESCEKRKKETKDKIKKQQQQQRNTFFLRRK